MSRRFERVDAFLRDDAHSSRRVARRGNPIVEYCTENRRYKKYDDDTHRNSILNTASVGRTHMRPWVSAQLGTRMVCRTKKFKIIDTITRHTTTHNTPHAQWHAPTTNMRARSTAVGSMHDPPPMMIRRPNTCMINPSIYEAHGTTTCHRTATQTSA